MCVELGGVVLDELIEDRHRPRGATQLELTASA
jgi:hypothetical protein